MAELLNVAKLVDRAAPPSEDRRAKWLRRCQLWSVSGILPTSASQLASEGRRRRLYRTETIWLAAVLLRVSNNIVDTNVLAGLSRDIQRASKGRSAFARWWRDVMLGNRSAYMFFSSTEMKITLGSTLDQFTPYLRDETAIILDLTEVFAVVRAHAAED
jgi:hypothetical protein